MQRVGVLVVLFSSAAAALGQDNGELLKAAQEAARAEKWDEAIALATKLIAAEPKNKTGYFFRAQVHESAGKFKEAVADFTKVLELDEKDARVYHLRGGAHFKAGNIAVSIADFDKYIELVPQAKVSHWQRGISLYYAGRYDDGAKQFEGYQDFDSNDVENAVWRFMCMARKSGIPKAQEAMLKIGKDKRVPMREVYDLYLGKLKPADVFKAARGGKDDKPEPEQLNRQLFYAHLYVGIWHELNGDKEKALAELGAAADKHKIGHYMWDVARVHRDLLAKEIEKGKGRAKPGAAAASEERDFTATPVEPKKDAATGFIVGGKNETALIRKLAAINGRAIAELEEDMRPGAASEAGFLGRDEALLEVLAKDNDFVLGRGRTHQELASHLHVLGGIGGKHGSAAFRYHGRRFKVEMMRWRGYQDSPFRDGAKTNADAKVTNLETDKKLQFSLLVPHMIERYGFYEGQGTRYRVEPAQILAVLDFLGKP
jgi:lipoprotein NlpI